MCREGAGSVASCGGAFSSSRKRSAGFRDELVFGTSWFPVRRCGGGNLRCFFIIIIIMVREVCRDVSGAVPQMAAQDL